MAGGAAATRHECVHVEPPGAAAGASPAATRKALLDADAKAELAAAEQQADAMRAAARDDPAHSRAHASCIIGTVSRSKLAAVLCLVEKWSRKKQMKVLYTK